MRTLAAVVVAAGLAVMPSAASAARTVPQGFVGLHMDDPLKLVNAGVSLDAELARAAANGVETIRFPIYWSNLQPYETMDAVPEARRSEFTAAADGGAPFRWALLDSFVRAAASNRIQLVPTLMGAPGWAADRNYPTGKGEFPLTMPIPASFERFGRFAADLTARYGSTGSFWTDNPSVPKVPVLTWQIWNEPNFSYYWPQHLGEDQTVTVLVSNRPTVKTLPKLYFAPTYVDLVRKSRAAIKAVDPKAKIMLASMANSDRRTRLPETATWVDLTYVYRAGGKGTFDLVGANLFTGLPTNLVTYLGWYRAAMKAGGDTTLPVTITEMSWSGSAGSVPLVDDSGTPNKMASLIVTPTLQASNLAAGFKAFVGARTKSYVNGVFWHTWDTGYADTTDVWDWTGLVQRTGSTVTPKPLLTSFKNYAFSVEGACKRKVLATDCLKR